MPFVFKPQQQLALDYPGNVAVSAGAGSGKTRVLVEKYFQLLADEHPDWAIDSVVAITFTVKAAGELKQRIVQRVREELKQPDLLPARRERLKEMRREISGAPIGTIHNFCSRTLREFSFDARLNPDFVIVEGARESSLRRDAAIQAVADAASAPGTRAYEDVVTLHNVYRRPQIFAMLGSMLAKRSEFLPACRAFADSDEESLFGELKELCGGLAADMKQRLYHELQHCIGAFSHATGTKADELIVPYVLRLQQYDVAEGTADELLQIAQELRTAVFTKEGTLRKTLEKGLGISPENSCVQRLLAACEACEEAGLLSVGESDRHGITLTAMLARLFLSAEQLYGESRSAARSADEVDMLDFTDLELLAEQLIAGRPRVRTALRQRIKYLIVDEFQDTSEIQWRILGPVVCDDEGHMLPSRFFMVGDPKQGVYGFRQASSRLFTYVRDLVVASNADVGGCLGDISIAYNFRTLPNPLRTVNNLFSGLMNPDVQHDVRFEALEPQRNSAEGSTSLLLTQKPPRRAAATDEEEDDPAAEAELVADEIAALVQQDYLQGGTIAVLLRKRKHFEPYEFALRVRGIPYLTHRGRGLYEQPEVLELIAVLRLLADPGNDLVAAQVARGPLFNFPDDLLLKASLATGSTFWQKCCNLQQLGMVKADGVRIPARAGELDRLRLMSSVMAQLERMLGFYPVVALLQHAIQETGALAIFGAGDRGAQALANVRRFLDLTRESGAEDLDEFLAYVESESMDSTGQGEAPVHSATGAVQIMTIHAAKGLEFDTVFLPELAEPIVARREEVMTDGAKWVSLQRTLSAERPRLFLMWYLAREKEKRAMAEEKRVLYVAMTRCKDHLVLSAARGGPREQDSFYGWIQPRIGELGIEERGSRDRVHPGGGLLRQTGAPDPETAELHNGAFESRTAELRQFFGIEPSTQGTTVGEQSRRRPFSPSAPAPANRLFALEALFAARFASEEVTAYLCFRHAFAAGLPYLAGSIGTAVEVAMSAGRCAITPDRETLQSAYKALQSNRALQGWRSAAGLCIRDGELLLQCRADLQVADSLIPTHVFVSPHAGTAELVSELARWYLSLIQNGQVNAEVGVFDVEKRSVQLLDAGTAAALNFSELATVYMHAIDAAGPLELERLLL
jgi:ATP-dependent helicase/nuclease subunit A